MVTDFGLAKKVEGDSGLTATGQILGTPGYMRPEQASGKIDEVTETADVYSLGAILYTLLTGRPPFQADNPLDTLMQVLEREPVSPRTLNPKVPLDLETICLKCLEKDRRRRNDSALTLTEELQRFLDGKAILARPIGRPARLWRWCKRKPTLAGLCVVAVILLLVLSIGGPMFGIQQAKYAAKQRDNARQQSALRAKADEQSQRADKEAAAAKAAERDAIASGDEARRNLKIAERNAYNSDMLLVQREWDDANIGHLRELLDRIVTAMTSGASSGVTGTASRTASCFRSKETPATHTSTTSPPWRSARTGRGWPRRVETRR